MSAHARFRTYDDWRADDGTSGGAGLTRAQGRALGNWSAYDVAAQGACAACRGTGWSFLGNDGAHYHRPPQCGYLSMSTCNDCNGNGKGPRRWTT